MEPAAAAVAAAAKPRVSIAFLVLLLANTCNAASWDDDDRSWSSSSGGGWGNSGSSWGGQQQFSSTPGSSISQSGSATPGLITPGPPPAPTRSNGNSKSRRHGKDAQMQPGFSGGFLPKTHRCNNPDLAGCQSCTGDVCTACYATLGLASFIMDPESHQCVCPPGYGKIAEEDMPQWYSSLSLSMRANITGNTSSSSSSSIVLGFTGSSETSAAAPFRADPATIMQLQPAMQQMPPPPWATDCLPCPVNYFSPGGSIGFAQCKPCPGSWTTGNATASADCMVPYCPAGYGGGLRNGRCYPCRFGYYRPNTATYNTTCTPCPVGFTTPARGATSIAACRVPICAPGQQLDIDLFVCRNCTGNTISPGGVRANGPYQPFCQECPTFTAAVNRTQCFQTACPPPDAFRIVCRTDQLPQCGPGAKPINLANFCTAFPIGAQLSWIRATITAPAQSGGDVVYGPGIPVNPGIAYCPAGANGSNVWYPAITSFNGLTNCFCTAAATCQFTAQSTAPADTAAVTQNTAINITLFDPQLVSLRWLLGSIAPANYTQIGIRLGSYCLPDPLTSLNISTSCLNDYLAFFRFSPWPGYTGTLAFGTLPPAVRLPGLSHLQELNCTNCGLVSSLPPDWGKSNNLQALKFLTLPGNSFTGTLPPSWGGLVNLVNLTLSSAVVMPSIPSFWSNMRSLALANFTQLQLDPTACAPASWSSYNGLIPAQTLLMPSTTTQYFCTSKRHR